MCHLSKHTFGHNSDSVFNVYRRAIEFGALEDMKKNIFIFIEMTINKV